MHACIHLHRTTLASSTYILNPECPGPARQTDVSPRSPTHNQQTRTYALTRTQSTDDIHGGSDKAEGPTYVYRKTPKWVKLASNLVILAVYGVLLALAITQGKRQCVSMCRTGRAGE